MNELVRYNPQLPMSEVDMRMQVNLIQKVMKEVMKPDVHYGKIPGTPKVSLWKPGAEVLCVTFHIAPSFKIEDLGGKGFARYRVCSIGTHQGTSIVLGEGWGACSSLEEKYKWRKTNSNAEWDNTPEEFRRTKYGYDKQERREYEVKQVRMEPADIDNTILKMAVKRAHVSMTLNVTAASDIFTQDIEDLPEGFVHDEGTNGRAEVEQPRGKQNPPPPRPDKSNTAKSETAGAEKQQQSTDTSGKPLQPGQIKILRAKMSTAGVVDQNIEGKFGKPLDQLRFDQFAGIQAFIAEMAAS